MSTNNETDNNLTNLVDQRPPALSIKSKVKAAVQSLNHNETPTKPTKR